ncbi:MAG: tRNA epoxyqueuosine(34) reductase QueG [Puniceicoccales bacterium]|jgi:epoxyqueuosine reductase|nr:tRNA epoxyqueuosine(34) reductase QueG [Puniceicoccales bacterium]
MPPKEPSKARLRAMATELGFQAFGIAPVCLPLRREYFLRWLAGGYHGAMLWMERNNDRRLQPPHFLPGAQSILMLGLDSHQPAPRASYTIARYALGTDYHNFILKRLKKLCALMRELGGEQRPCVDTAPVMEKAIAAHAGIGWQGKSTLLINRKLGGWLLLGTIFTTLSLEPDEPERDNCGSCTRCIDTCPTGAITAPWQLDTRRCLSAINKQPGDIPEAFRPLMGKRIFGCDACIEACPWGNRPRTSTEECLTPRALPQRLRDTLEWTEADFLNAFSGTAVKRLGLSNWLRNACIVLGNTGTDEDLPALQKHAAGRDAFVAHYAIWAMERILARTPCASAAPRPQISFPETTGS